jgi:hypothetical protein
MPSESWATTHLPQPVVTYLGEELAELAVLAARQAEAAGQPQYDCWTAAYREPPGAQPDVGEVVPPLCMPLGDSVDPTALCAEAVAAAQQLLEFPYQSLAQPTEDLEVYEVQRQVPMAEAGLGYKNAKRGKKIPAHVRRQAIQRKSQAKIVLDGPDGIGVTSVVQALQALGYTVHTCATTSTISEDFAWGKLELHVAQW